MSTNSDSKRGRPLDFSVISGNGERIGSTPKATIAAQLCAAFGGKGARIEKGGALLYWHRNASETAAQIFGILTEGEEGAEA